MNKIIVFTLAFLAVSCGSIEKENDTPNIIYILADDLGYGELGINGQKFILTPNIDALASSGMTFTQHYSGAPVCAPARCILLTGMHAGHAHIRGNDEWGSRGNVWDYKAAVEDPGLEGQRPIPDQTVTIAERLKSVGYKTAVVGKWGLGAPGTEGIPNRQGFDYFYGYNCQRQAHNLYPPYLWENELKDTLRNEVIAPGTLLDDGVDIYDELSYERYTQQDYAPEKMHQKALRFIKENHDVPFFLYYASPLPHLPLQAPKEAVEKYREILGEEEPYTGKSYFPNRYPRATYAAMISYLDEQVGSLVETLTELGIYENTIIMFSSDNGPTYTGGVDFDYFESSSPYTNGHGRTKGFTYEGGIHIPFIASWPKKIEAGSSSDYISAFYDIFPTICDFANIDIEKEMDGISLKPVFFGNRQKEHEYLYWEFPSYQGQQAVRMGKWKGIRKDIFKGNMNIELYDLESDIKEQNDIASNHPDIVIRIEEIMIAEHEAAVNDRFKITQIGDEKQRGK
jgi:arylsulfatase A-like enzyme